MPFLEREALADRGRQGPITTVRCRHLHRMLERGLRVPTQQRGQLLPAPSRSVRGHGRPGRLARIALRDHRIARRPAVRPLCASTPGDDLRRRPRTAGRATGLRVVDAGTNTLLATADYDVVFERLVVDDPRFVAHTQTAAGYPSASLVRESEKLMLFLAAVAR